MEYFCEWNKYRNSYIRFVAWSDLFWSRLKMILSTKNNKTRKLEHSVHYGLINPHLFTGFSGLELQTKTFFPAANALFGVCLYAWNLLHLWTMCFLLWLFAFIFQLASTSIPRQPTISQRIHSELSLIKNYEHYWFYRTLRLYLF